MALRCKDRCKDNRLTLCPSCNQQGVVRLLEIVPNDYVLDLQPGDTMPAGMCSDKDCGCPVYLADMDRTIGYDVLVAYLTKVTHEIHHQWFTVEGYNAYHASRIAETEASEEIGDGHTFTALHYEPPN